MIDLILATDVVREEGAPVIAHLLLSLIIITEQDYTTSLPPTRSVKIILIYSNGAAKSKKKLCEENFHYQNRWFS